MSLGDGEKQADSNSMIVSASGGCVGGGSGGLTSCETDNTMTHHFHDSHRHHHLRHHQSEERSIDLVDMSKGVGLDSKCKLSAELYYKTNDFDINTVSDGFD